MRITFRPLLVTTAAALSILLLAGCEEETRGGSSPAAEETVDAEAIALAELFSMTPEERETLCDLYAIEGSDSIRDLPWNFADAWYEEAVEELIDELRTKCP